MKLELDQFNSEIFGFNMGNVVEIDTNITLDSIDEVLFCAKKEGYKNLIAKVNTSDKSVLNCFIKKGFIIADTQIMYELKCNGQIAKGIQDTNSNILYREKIVEDVNQIMSIARTSFVLDQFHSDEALNKESSDRYYEQWAENSCNGFADKVFVLAQSNKIIGFITLNINKDTAMVGLAAISNENRGKGLFNILIINTLQYLEKIGIHFLNYGTQLCNAPVLKTMARFGGVPISSNYVLHMMLY